MLLKFETLNKQAFVKIKIKKQKIGFCFQVNTYFTEYNIKFKAMSDFFEYRRLFKRKIVWTFFKHFRANIFQVLKKVSLKKLNLLLKQVQNCNHI